MKLLWSLIFCLALLTSPVMAASTMNFAELYLMNSAAQKIDIEMYTDQTHIESGWYMVRMRWKSGLAFYYPKYGCAVTSLNNFIAAVNDKGIMNLQTFANMPTYQGQKWE